MDHQEEEEDRLSSLPKIILHDILSRLPEKDANRTCVLSKTWLDTWNTFPNLSFSIERSTENILSFCDYVKKRMLRFRDQSLAIKKFKLNVYRCEIPHMSKDVDIWLKLACESGVEVIDYFAIDFIAQGQYYDFPMCVFEAKSLTKLLLQGYIKIEPIFVNHTIKFFSLRELSMIQVLLRDEQTIQHLISCCPLIEDISLISCRVLSPSSGTVGLFEPLNRLSLSGLQKLKKVVLGIPEVFIDAPTLEILSYGFYASNAPFKINFDSCRNLKELYLWFMKHTFFTDKWFLDLFRKFPFLECLVLSSCELCERINISSVRLKVLKLLACYNFKEVNINAPNLLSCECEYRTGALIPMISFLRNSSQLKIKTEFNFVDLCNLRKFVENIKPHGVLTSLSLSINPPSMDAHNPIELQVTSPPPSIKNLNLDLCYQKLELESFPHNESLLSSLVNIILSSCCPSTISFSLEYYIINRAFIEFFYETLMRRKDYDCFCNSSDIKCWWHDLKDVKVTKMNENVDLKTIIDSLPMKMDENVDWKTMLDSLPAFKATEKISFMLEF